MAYVFSSGQLSSVLGPSIPSFSTAVQLGDDVYADHAAIWAANRSVRTVVSFLARNIAQIGLHWYRRVSDTDRVRVLDHPVVSVFSRPNPLMRLTPYRLFDRLVNDLGIYDNAFWLKVRLDGVVVGLVPVPPERVRPAGGNWLAPERYEIWTDGRWSAHPPEDVVHQHGYDPRDPRVGNSPMNGLRDLLMEEYEATRTRRQMWRNGGRLSGVLERPVEAPAWERKDRDRFRASWRAAYTGNGSDAGGTPLLEDGMTYKPVGLDPKSAQYVESRKLTREEAAAAYHVSPVFVGVLDHATYSNITEQHKNLYQDTLGPWLQMIQQDIQEQLVPDFPDVADLYCEFNIGEKLKGSFEEQAAAASTATGAPWMTRNEQRARANLPAVPGGDELITPLNVLVGGLSSPRDTAPDTGKALPSGALRRVKSATARRLSTLESDLLAWLDAQAAMLTSRLGVKALPSLDEVWRDQSEQDTQLAELLAGHGQRVATAAAVAVLDVHNPGRDGWSADKLTPWVQAAAGTYAHAMNKGTEKALLLALSQAEDWQDRVRSLFADRSSYAQVWSQRVLTEVGSFGGHDAAKASGLTTKTWVSGDSGHTWLDGTTVELADAFPEVGRWPGDFRGGVDNAEHCYCSLTFG